MEENSVKKKCALLVIGGSAGSLEIILHLLPQLKLDLPFAIVIVIHRKVSSESLLPDLFASRTSVPVKEAEDKDALEPGHIYIAPADYHLLVEKDKTLSLDFSEKVNFSRPSIDVTFDTAAEAYADSLVCILLSGASADGASGLKTVKNFGGVAIVQNPQTAEVSYMPEQAIASVQVDLVIDAGKMAEVINSL